ncbi:MAG: transcription-repair coupling factor [Deltaproteobacteria bacterium]|nr:transcription-repair coupling factor [Deltaproteobacteria bacterium]
MLQKDTIESNDGPCSMKALLPRLIALGAFDRNEAVTVSVLFGSSKALLIASVFRGGAKPHLVILKDEEAASEMAVDLRFFLGKDSVLFYPSTETLPFELDPPHEDISAERVAALHSFTLGSSVVVVAAVSTLMQRLPPKADFTAKALNLRVGGEYPREALIETLSNMGYARMSMVEERAEMSARGGILDIFPPAKDRPLRLEFFGDELESIRSFDIATQRSLTELKEALILAAREASPDKEILSTARDRLIDRADALGLDRLSWEALSDRLKAGASGLGLSPLLPLLYDRLDTIFDYLGSNAVITVVDPEAVKTAAQGFAKDVSAIAAKAVEKRRFFAEPAELYISPDAFLKAINVFSLINVEPVMEAGFVIGASARLNIAMRHDLNVSIGGKGSTVLETPLAPLASMLKDRLEAGCRVWISAHNKGQAERTKELLEGYGLAVSQGFSFDVDPLNAPLGALCVVIGSITSGFYLEMDRFWLISEEEVFGERVKARTPPARKLDAFLRQLQELSDGDLVVHKDHGIGLCRGLKRLGIDDVENDFLLLEYRDGDKLYLPVWRLDLISRYKGSGGQTPELDKLGAKNWEKRKKKVGAAVERFAGELLNLYAQRQSAVGFSFSPPDRIFEEFEAGFDFEETPDQKNAIAETLADMRSDRPMDRLICGDVGYGKTEVAMRAAFKAALDNKQTAILVPTTILADQHFNTFSRRCAPFPVKIGVLSRFKTAKEQRETIASIALGEVDIVIGTHRLLQKDVTFKDLGLIVIDEEHRFGVAHKERLKHLRKNVDCLTLTATPIPRTLNLSIASIRELSIISTPPVDRLAIKTSVARFDPEIIAEALEREFKRGGQVFFVHNRVESIGAMERFLREVAPKARIAVAHGQMKEHELERKMLGFVNKDYDLLLCTTIIESGLDIPSANTIIINRADRFGLAELYQLRGRVGRSSHRAYAYLLCPDSGSMSADAVKRLEVIRELAEPGSGFSLASYDLEIRGAGELLGQAQAGQFADVGFDMYATLLEDAVRELRGEALPDSSEPDVNLRVSQYIPEEYIPDARERLGLYQRLSSIATDDDIYLLNDELSDRYGDPPALVGNLLRTASLRIVLKRLKATEFKQIGDRLYITFAKGVGPEIGDRALNLVKKEPKRYRIAPDSRLIISIDKDADPLETAKFVLKELEG